jgi:hypothetical protein
VAKVPGLPLPRGRGEFEGGADQVAEEHESDAAEDSYHRQHATARQRHAHYLRSGTPAHSSTLLKRVPYDEAWSGEDVHGAAILG